MCGRKLCCCKVNLNSKELWCYEVNVLVEFCGDVR